MYHFIRRVTVYRKQVNRLKEKTWQYDSEKRIKQQ